MKPCRGFGLYNNKKVGRASDGSVNFHRNKPQNVIGEKVRDIHFTPVTHRDQSNFYNMEYEFALDICEEGELPLSPIKDTTPTRSTPGSLKGLPSLVMERHPFVTRETQHQVMERLSRLKREWHCQPCNYTVVGGEQTRVNAWSHHVAFVLCQCGFLTACHDTMMGHVQRTHKDHHSITQVDASCWEKLRETHCISQRMPTLPIIHLGKERKRQLPITPVPSTGGDGGG